MSSINKDTKDQVPVTVHAVDSLDDKVLLNGKKVQLNDGDEIMKLGLAYEDGDVELTPEIDRKLVRKIDLHLLPIMCLVYCFQFLDKLSNSFSSILGLREDLGMTGDMYSWTGSAFYLGYLAFEYPATRILQKFPLARTSGVLIFIWGIMLALHAVPNYAGFITLRVILGALESSITPAFSQITSQYYKQHEVFLRMTIWFASNGAGFMIGSGVIAYNLANNQDNYSIAAWKLVFIISGVITAVLGILVFFGLPDSPATAWFLSDTEKRYVVHRIRGNQKGFGNKHFKKEQLIEALTDYKCWLLALYSLVSNIPNGALTNFGSIVLTDIISDLAPLGLNEADHEFWITTHALLYQMVTGAVELGGCILIAYMTTFYLSRMVWALVASVMNSTGQLMLAFSKNKTAQFAGYSITGVSPVAFICILSFTSSNVCGTTKSYTSFYMTLVAYCVGNLIGPQTFLAREAPTYTTGKTVIGVCAVLTIIILGIIGLAYHLENKRRDKLPEPEKIENIEFADLTDKQNPFFRYAL